MTISSTITKASYVGDGIVSNFAVTFKFILKADIVVTLVNDLTQVETVQLLDTDYTLTTPGDTGTVVMTPTVPITGETLIIERVLILIQSTDYVENDAFPANSHELALDRLVMINQQLEEQLSRALKLSLFSSLSISGDLPIPVVGKVLGWNQTLDGITNYDSSSIAVGAAVTNEEQTATDAQTIFTLTGMTYTPSAGNLVVHINGVKQGANAYIETSSTIVTFTEGLSVGDLVQFVSGTVVSNAITQATAVVYSPDGVGAVDTNVQTKLRESVSVKDFGAKGDGSTNDFAAIQLALDAINVAGGGTVILPPGNDIYNVDCTSAALDIYSNTVLDLGGNTIHRTDTFDRRTMGNSDYGGTTNVNISIINGKITGVGADNTVTGQGSAITLFGVDGYKIENIETDNTTGDGLGFRTADNGYLRNIKIGDFGRNGISPTSGVEVFWDNVEIAGSPFVGANPGIDIDAENNNASEITRMYWNGVVAGNATFVDFFTSGGGDFSHELYMVNCKIGPGFLALRFKSTNDTIAKNIYVGSTNSISASGLNGSCIVLDNVSGVNINGPGLDVGTATGSHIGVSILNKVDDLSLINPKFTGGFSQSLQCFLATDLLTNSLISGVDGKIYLTGNDNTFHNCNGSINISRAASIDNVFDETCHFTSINLVNSALLIDQFFGSIRGTRSLSYYSVSEAISDGSTYDLTVPLPDASGDTNGRSVTIIANYSHKGNVLHWANLITTIVYGVTTQAERTVISSTDGGSGAITVNSVAIDSCVLRLAYTFSGNFSATVIG